MTDQPTRRPPARRKTLAGIVGAATAALLLSQIPMEESGRVVAVSIAPDGAATVRNVSGRQYLRAYLDIVGVATACDGLTSYQGRKITTRDQFTEAQCAVMLEDALVEHAEGVMACTPGLSLTLPRRDMARFAAVSLAYNIGVPRYCHSTAHARFNAGLIRQGCDAIPAWNRAGGRVNRGLVARRERERAKCLLDA
jgi:lysozyme